MCICVNVCVRVYVYMCVLYLCAYICVLCVCHIYAFVCVYDHILGKMRMGIQR